MGQRCTCLCNKDLESTYNFYPESQSMELLENNNEVIQKGRKSIANIIKDEPFIQDDFKKTKTNEINNDMKKYIKQNISYLIKIQRFIKKVTNKVLFEKNIKKGLIELRENEVRMTIKTYSLTQNTFCKKNFQIKTRNDFFEYYNKNNNMLSYVKSNCDRIYDVAYNYSDKVYPQILIDKIKNTLYKGNVNIDLVKTGYGILYYQNGDVYEGNWNNNEFTGYGRHTDSKGNIIEGLFEAFKINTFGEMWTSDNCYYIGAFNNNIKQGTGKESSKISEYEGDFYQNKKHGVGKIVYKNVVESYEGEFNKDEITGRGTYTWANKDQFSGDFVNGKMHGKGEYLWPEGGRYVGEYKNNIKEGKGIFYWTNGRVYEGEFERGKPHGKGIIKQFGKEYIVTFENGNLKEKHKIESNTEMIDKQSIE
jgi:hypothetical protein